ncbi:hypothetical protein P5V78_12845 [Mycobacteroides abscessus subsp. abscessus]|uniref:hypothetical protein n=1 Tax=Mycobacteroides abscessus TaxID=36809 RepID=UPI000925C1BB|nr:hypothetical protein [Mycobacteroides abscessus]MBN7402840.1 hypothetical protein [Mycobacteroides abscessus subsp. abscessus]MDO3088877.1 hypothetical protein [Mycobacteroides abscessus subsp. abscessus]MDO3270658.1 hypothetical protein [Mycobacteroides abscessus subsp. abscessus]SHQ37770.1 Uncharacterised protein [Mycobacteroides abscessus subsp. abscessus]SHY83274.1 Uncharacterised protein [Mycobacteroides abscessus subsp. abscessus]
MSVPTSIDVQQDLLTKPPALPVGADPRMSESQFEDYDGVPARLVWSPEMALPEHLADRNIALAVAQRLDGSIITDNPHLAPAIYVFDTNHTVSDARAVAKALTDAADLADLWIGGAR